MIRKPSTLIQSLMICCACAVFAIAQAVYGSVFGTITDARGSGVPGATVTITNTGTNVVETVKTDGSGYYNQTRLIPGRYRVKVEASGFKTAVIETVVISVDTAVAHLAGALGVRTLVLLPFDADWRWLTGRSDSPWYPSATLYRQQADRRWELVVARMLADLPGRGHLPT